MKSKQIYRVVSISLILIIFLTACTTQQQLYGKWEETVSHIQLTFLHNRGVTYEFADEDGIVSSGMGIYAFFERGELKDQMVMTLPELDYLVQWNLAGMNGYRVKIDNNVLVLTNNLSGLKYVFDKVK